MNGLDSCHLDRKVVRSAEARDCLKIELNEYDATRKWARAVDLPAVEPPTQPQFRPSALIREIRQEIPEQSLTITHNFVDLGHRLTILIHTKMI
jgi:hypothetical protein